MGTTLHSPWRIRFDNRVLNPKLGFIRTGGWRAAVRRVAELETPIMQTGASVRIVEFSGSDLYGALRGCRALLLELGFPAYVLDAEGRTTKRTRRRNTAQIASSRGILSLAEASARMQAEEVP